MSLGQSLRARGQLRGRDLRGGHERRVGGERAGHVAGEFDFLGVIFFGEFQGGFCHAFFGSTRRRRGDFIEPHS